MKCIGVLDVVLTNDDARTRRLCTGNREFPPSHGADILRAHPESIHCKTGEPGRWKKEFFYELFA